MKTRLLIYTVFIFTQITFADVKSLDGTIKFKIQNSEKLRLNETGLGIFESNPTANLHVQGNAIISDKITIGGPNTGSSNLFVNGSLSFSHLTVTSNTTLQTDSYILADTSSDNLTLTLPYAGNVEGQSFTIKKISSLNNLYIKSGGNYIDNDYHLSLNSEGTTLPCATFISDGSKWHITHSLETYRGIASSNLVGHWTLDENSSAGNIAFDLSSYQSHGTLNDISSANIGVTGKVLKAIDFDGDTDAVVLGDLSHLEGDSMKYFSISVWVYMVDDTADSDIILKGIHTANQPFVLWRDNASPDRYAFLMTDQDNDYTSPRYSSTSATLNTWTHVAFTFSSNLEARMYLDGIEDANSPFSMTNYDNIKSNTDTWKIGHDLSGNSTDFHGKIDDLRIYNKVLSQSEIVSIFQLAN